MSYSQPDPAEETTQSEAPEQPDTEAPDAETVEQQEGDARTTSVDDDLPEGVEGDEGGTDS